MERPIVEERFEYKGFLCVVLFQPMGYRTGYVGLPKGHKYYKKDYNKLPIDCHCGLTYSREYLYGQEDKETWWIGFDCGHICDSRDIDSVKNITEKKKQIEFLTIFIILQIVRLKEILTM